MHPLTLADIRPPAAYEPVRAEARRHILEMKRHRRVGLGDLLGLVFENRETVRSVVEELLRAEGIEDPGRIEEELQVFNPLVPGERELCATLFLEITDPAELTPRLGELRGIEAAVHLEVGGERVTGVAEDGRSRAGRTSSVHSLRFRLTEEQQAAFVGGAVEVALVADHPAYRARATLDDRQRLAVGADLGGR
ncbi:MAG TPA: DUF3501 family protein [Candidatus Dormibacteraeota bacterium]|nr:DUF3501 family protein [Candidatus Dormibacteraeota bacterium]